MKPVRYTTLLFLLLCIGYKSTAQIDIPADIRKTKINTALTAPDGKSAFADILSRFTISSAFGDESAKAALAIPYVFNANATGNLNIAMKQSFDSRPKKVTFLNLDGLSNGTTLTIGGNLLLWKPQMDNDGLNKILNNYSEKHGLGATHPDNLTWQDLDARGKMDADRFIRYGVPVILNLSYSINHVDYKYINTKASTAINDTFIKEKTFFNQSFNVAAGIFLPHAWVLSIGWAAQFKDNASSPDTYMFPVSGSNLTQSNDVVVGEPEQKAENKFTLEIRKSFAADKKMLAAISPNINFYTAANKFSLSLPVYIFQSEESKLQGGFNLGYLSPTNKLNSLKDGFSAEIFISAPFDLFGL